MINATAQHDRLKAEELRNCSTGTAHQPESEWSERIAQLIAAQTGIQLSEAHWIVIGYVRDYYLESGFVRRSPKLSSALNARCREQGAKNTATGFSAADR